MTSESRPLQTRGEFLSWCGRAGLCRETTGSIFDLSSQTLRNWEKDPEVELPLWIALCVDGYEAWESGPFRGRLPVFPKPSTAWFESWATTRGLSSHAERGRIFGHSRQTVSKWFKNGLPAWLPLACLGVEAQSLIRVNN